MSLVGPRATCGVLCLASGFQTAPKLLGMPTPLPQLFGDPLLREGGWWVVTVMVLEHVPGSRLAQQHLGFLPWVLHSDGFVDLKNVNRVILWRSYEKAVDPLGSVSESLAFLIRHIIQTKMGWWQIKGGRILSPWHSQCLSSLYSHNTDNILLNSKPDF